MKNAEVSRQLQRLKALIGNASSVSAVEMQSHWARYCCVVLAGLIENAVKELYSDFIRRACNNQVGSYANHNLTKINNPNGEKLIQIVRSFDSKWAEDLDSYLKDDGRKDAIDAIMNNRHFIAHGKDSGITIARLKGYFSRVEDVIKRMESQTNP